jgi:CDP-glycerol glycerophosphotransferase (TagB/SpsB family)
LRQFDRIGFINEDRLRRYVTSGSIRDDQAVLIGFPKLDDLVNGRWQRDAVLRSLGLSADLETILYAPTFSTANSLHEAGDAIVDTLLGTGRNVIVKLHDRSMVPHSTYTNGVDWPARFGRFDGHQRFVLARVADASPLLAAADVLVTDHSTVGFEFALLDRPIVVFDAPRLLAAARIDPGKWALLRSMADVVTSRSHLGDAIERALQAPARLATARRQAHELFAHAGSATERALIEAYRLLHLSPLRRPEPVPSRPGVATIG